ncbi:MAG: glycosyltransferase family 4 protein [bacterium]|nr:glycosyltransferase family 4 protein [bacterium]
MSQNKKPKMLIALARFPYPVTDGTRYKILFNVVNAAKADFDIEFLILSLKKIPKGDLVTFENNHGKVNVFYIPPILFVFNAARKTFSTLPFQVNGFFSRTVSRWVNSNIQKYDLVYIHTIRMTEYFSDPFLIERHKIIVDFNDALSLNYAKAQLTARFPFSLFYSLEAPRMRLYEKKILNTFPNLSVISEFDKDYLLWFLSAENEKKVDFRVMPYGMETKTVGEKTKLTRNIYFIGQLDYEMNRSAVEFLLEELWVPLNKLIPDIQVFIIGKGGKSLRRKYKRLKGVVFTGFVEDQYDILGQCSALVAPILSGAGMSTKIIEAMASRIPVVTTPLGARGISGLHQGNNICIVSEEDKDAWVQVIQKLVTEQSVNDFISKNAFDLFKESYELSHVQKMWLQFFVEVARKE